MQLFFVSGDRLQNFEIRVGNDGDEIGNNGICYKQLEPMAPGITKNSYCPRWSFGSWISSNKSHSQPYMIFSAFPRITGIWQ